LLVRVLLLLLHVALCHLLTYWSGSVYEHSPNSSAGLDCLIEKAGWDLTKPVMFGAHSFPNSFIAALTIASHSPKVVKHLFDRYWVPYLETLAKEELGPDATIEAINAAMAKIASQLLILPGRLCAISGLPTEIAAWYIDNYPFDPEYLVPAANYTPIFCHIMHSGVLTAMSRHKKLDFNLTRLRRFSNVEPPINALAFYLPAAPGNILEAATIDLQLFKDNFPIVAKFGIPAAAEGVSPSSAIERLLNAYPEEADTLRRQMTPIVVGSCRGNQLVEMIKALQMEEFLSSDQLVDLIVARIFQTPDVEMFVDLQASLRPLARRIATKLHSSRMNGGTVFHNSAIDSVELISAIIDFVGRQSKHLILLHNDTTAKRAYEVWKLPRAATRAVLHKKLGLTPAEVIQLVPKVLVSTQE